MRVLINLLSCLAVLAAGVPAQARMTLPVADAGDAGDATIIVEADSCNGCTSRDDTRCPAEMADCSMICLNGTQMLGTVVSVQVVVASMVKPGWIFPPRPLLGLSPSPEPFPPRT
ncbi:MAG: hypothetical protein KIT82_03515 [Bradyrhizobium sp.]|nr:hypothetical protein [Bradyrhizobium sp.]